MEQTMKCGKVISSQGRHIHVKFCPICSEEESKKNVILDINKGSKLKSKNDINLADSDPKIETKTDIKEADSDSKNVIDATKEATETDINFTDSDSKTEDEDDSWGIRVLGIALLGLGLLAGVLYLAYKWITRTSETKETNGDKNLHGISGNALSKPMNILESAKLGIK